MYNPEKDLNHSEEVTIYVKFSNNITFLESFLKQNKIDYQKEDLEDTPLGKGYVIRREKDAD